MKERSGWSCPDCNTANNQLHSWCIVCGELRPDSGMEAEPPDQLSPTAMARRRELIVALVILAVLVIVGAGAWFLA